MLSVSLLDQVYRLAVYFFSFFSEDFSSCYLGVFFLVFRRFRGCPGGLLEHFFVKKREFKDFGNTSKSMAGAVFQQV